MASKRFRASSGFCPSDPVAPRSGPPENRQINAQRALESAPRTNKITLGRQNAAAKAMGKCRIRSLLFDRSYRGQCRIEFPCLT
jgi:hypothetical protein